jgi:hypothetical protein
MGADERGRESNVEMQRLGIMKKEIESEAKVVNFFG